MRWIFIRRIWARGFWLLKMRSHMKEDEALQGGAAGRRYVAGLVRIGSPRLEELKRRNDAVGSEDASVHATRQEVTGASF